MNIFLRKMSVADVEPVNRLTDQLSYSVSIQHTEQMIRRIMDDEDEFALVAEADGTVIAWISAALTYRLESPPKIEIVGLVVDEQFRNRQIGRMLVQEVVAWCKKKNIRSLRVRSNVKRSDAHRFYTNLQFRESKEQKVFQLEL